MGYIPGTPFSIAVHGLIRVGRGGGQARRVKLPQLGDVDVEDTYPVIDVTALEALVSILHEETRALRDRIIDEQELRAVEEELAAILELIL